VTTADWLCTAGFLSFFFGVIALSMVSVHRCHEYARKHGGTCK